MKLSVRVRVFVVLLKKNSSIPAVFEEYIYLIIYLCVIYIYILYFVSIVSFSIFFYGIVSFFSAIVVYSGGPAVSFAVSDCYIGFEQDVSNRQ